MFYAPGEGVVNFMTANACKTSVPPPHPTLLCREQVTLGTGYGQNYARPDICDFHPQKTAVFLMAIGRLEELCEDLVRRSYPRDCPVAIVENASTPRQRLVSSTMVVSC